jgi:16S rRNA (cytosine967-C5)-methyltransferase
MIAPARTAAYDVLQAIDSGRSDLPHALARARSTLDDERDRALAGEIASGTLRWQASFDHVISEFTRRPSSRLDREVLLILRLTIFQLLHLDRVPASAAVNDAVSMTRRAGKKSAAPLVNAVLRRVSRERNRLPLPPRPEAAGDRGSVLDYLAVTLSHPRWLAARWLDRYGFDAAEAWMRFNNAPAALTLRANRLRATREEVAEALEARGVQTVATRFAPDGLVVTHGNPLRTPAADRGLFFVQEEASQLVPLMTGVAPGELVLDACASPGGKTIAMSAAMTDTGLIVASDVRGRRLELLAQTIAAAGAGNVRIVQADVSRALPFAPRFDCVLLDAPCSGLGTIRRDPDIKWRRSEADFEALQALQLRMIRESAAVLRPGGRLIYSTCSSEPEENEEVVRSFAASSHFEVVRPAGLPPAMAALVDADGYLRTYPFRDGVEAFFAAALRSPAAFLR